MRTQHNSGAPTGTDDLTAAAQVAVALHALRDGAGTPPIDPSFELAERTFGRQLPGFERHSATAWRTALGRAEARRGERRRTRGLGWLSTALVGGEINAATVVEIGCEKVRVSRLWCGADDGLPDTTLLFEAEWNGDHADVPDGSRKTRETPETRAGENRIGHLFAIARGIRTSEDIGDAVDRALRSAPLPRPAPARTSEPLVVVVRAAEWTAVEDAAARVDALRPAILWLRLPVGWPRHGPVDLLDGAPLRRALWFVATRVDGSTGAVDLARTPLFPAGSTSAGPGSADGQPPVAEVRVARPPSAGAPARHSAFVVTARPADEPADWLPVRADRVVLPVGAQTTLRYRLDAPGRMGLLFDGAHDPETTPWHLVVRHLPRRLYAPQPVDLVVAVETAGRRGDGEAQLADRLKRAQAVISATDAAVPDAHALRVGLIGYRDHRPLAGPGDRTPIHYSAGLRDAEAAARLLADWQHSPLHHDFATGLEHVPDELHTWHRQWRPDSLRVLLVVGARPPHPYGRPPQAVRRRARVRVCPDRFDWESSLAVLRHQQELRCLALVDPPDWMAEDAEPLVAEWARRAWTHFGRQGFFTVGDSPERVVETLLSSTRRSGDGTPPPMLVGAAGPSESWLAHPSSWTA
ncbi:hypothetical protein [Streptomyces fructofermentans]|uniref:Uncharacterized protein n=1 Tax=Streptomyces fructofermentans TaxID=152141 RepID=A0A918K2Y1_9ACTN|nr:hypothetical protein [Streptomyces fructofermentans]GGX44505.1 hypothetical protein GCM10010515_09240 [Streptomyces fructofermentans]